MLSYGDAYRGFSLADLERRRLSLHAYPREVGGGVHRRAAENGER